MDSDSGKYELAGVALRSGDNIIILFPDGSTGAFVVGYAYEEVYHYPIVKIDYHGVSIDMCIDGLKARRS